MNIYKVIFRTLPSINKVKTKRKIALKGKLKISYVNLLNFFTSDIRVYVQIDSNKGL